MQFVVPKAVSPREPLLTRWQEEVRVLHSRMDLQSVLRFEDRQERVGPELITYTPA